MGTIQTNHQTNDPVWYHEAIQWRSLGGGVLERLATEG